MRGISKHLIKGSRFLYIIDASTKILQVNLNSAAHNTKSALQVAIKLDIDIILVQELYVIKEADSDEIRSISHLSFT